ncbi:MAG TPA: iron-containing alcohol dehydrogenase [Clostridiales bacterium]|nr:iron-containing alcohol dehydrogenase [Clostridiales bacterium]
MQFQFLSAGKIVFGIDSIKEMGTLARQYGTNFLVISGSRTLRKSVVLDSICEKLTENKVKYYIHEIAAREPQLEDVDTVVQLALEHQCDGIISIGGGSAIDIGKAVSGLVTNGGRIIDYLEGVGTGKTIQKDTLPFIAVPTTAGTGSEVTKNAVICSSKEGFKKSIRSEKLIPDVALIDPRLSVSLPPKQTAYSGLDALTQLIEGYVTKKANPITDALAVYGLKKASRSLERAYKDGEDIKAREDMALASLMSGLVLANAGLGAVHGIAASLGANCGIGHGLACAVLLPSVIEYNSKKLPDKYAHIGCLIAGAYTMKEQQAVQYLLNWLNDLYITLNIPRRLSDLGVTKEKIEVIAQGSKGSSMSGNPVDMTEEDVKAILNELL